MISFKYLELGKGREETEWFVHISAIDNQHCELLQNREPLRLVKIGNSK
jgi:hypothetical protein